MYHSILPQVFGLRRLAPLLLVLLAGLLTGCAAYPYVSEGERALAQQPSSPLIPGQDTPLSRNEWRIVEVTKAGQPVQIAALSPLLLSFGEERGILQVRAMPCNAGSYVIAAQDEHNYRLYALDSTAQGCGEIGDRQAADFYPALVATTQLSIENNLLVMAGEDVRITAQIEQSPPQLPNVWCFDLISYTDGRRTIFAAQPGDGAGGMASIMPGATYKQRCFQTWVEAAYYISGGTVILPPEATKQDYLDAVDTFLDRPIPALP